MTGPRTQRYLSRLEELVRACDLQQLLELVGRDDVPEIKLDQMDAISTEDLLEDASMILIAIVHDVAAERGQHLHLVPDAADS